MFKLKNFFAIEPHFFIFLYSYFFLKKLCNRPKKKTYYLYLEITVARTRSMGIYPITRLSLL
ncbi:hypothetical protein FOR86_13035 [Bacillus anthracis]|nr:hypothetical protein [Bacillus anthracis]MXR63564.1 hypothetical protein [Bacillus anthracis]PTR64163.1 hypothetical protein DBA59_28065 [Bacillus anthracis]PTR68201.1 hypothetical protein DBA54_27740 [Bacillus anthracis]PTR88931.1 hypothetical protein DBA57_29195 [Bacillus anthracis]